MPSLSSHVYLIIAVVFEVLGTSLLQHSQQFTRLLPTAGMIACYLAAFYFLSLTLRTLSIGTTYAVWSGLGIVLISAVGFFVFKQALDTAAVIGIALIIAGVVVINVFSDTVAH